MAEIRVKVREAKPNDKHERPEEGVFETEVVWRPLYIQGGTRNVSWTLNQLVVWHVVGSHIDRYARRSQVPLCANVTGYGIAKKPITAWEWIALRFEQWRTYKTDRICKSCERVMNARARAHGVH